MTPYVLYIFIGKEFVMCIRGCAIEYTCVRVHQVWFMDVMSNAVLMFDCMLCMLCVILNVF